MQVTYFSLLLTGFSCMIEEESEKEMTREATSKFVNYFYGEQATSQDITDVLETIDFDSLVLTDPEDIAAAMERVYDMLAEQPDEESLELLTEIFLTFGVKEITMVKAIGFYETYITE